MNFEERLKAVFLENNIEILEFTHEKQKIVYKCLDCGKIYTYACARNLFSKITLCKNCYNPFGRWNPERLMRYKFSRLFPNSEMEIIEYHGPRNGTIVKCKKCGNEQYIQNTDAFFCARKDTFCENCEKERDLTYKHVMKELEKGYLTLLEWNGARDKKSKFQCNRCGHIFERTVSTHFDGKICPNCFKIYNKFTFEQGQELLNKKLGEGYQLLQFKGTNERCLIKHLKCGMIFSDRLNDIQKTRGCPKCSKRYSRLEQNTEAFLLKNNFAFERQKRFSDLNRYSFDFCVNFDNGFVLLEVQGEQHYREASIFSSFEKQQERDNIKRDFCLINNYPLIEIPYWEVKNLENFLLPKLNDYKVELSNSK